MRERAIGHFDWTIVLVGFAVANNKQTSFRLLTSTVSSTSSKLAATFCPSLYIYLSPIDFGPLPSPLQVITPVDTEMRLETTLYGARWATIRKSANKVCLLGLFFGPKLTRNDRGSSSCHSVVAIRSGAHFQLLKCTTTAAVFGVYHPSRPVVVSQPDNGQQQQQIQGPVAAAGVAFGVSRSLRPHQSLGCALRPPQRHPPPPPPPPLPLPLPPTIITTMAAKNGAISRPGHFGWRHVRKLADQLAFWF